MYVFNGSSDLLGEFPRGRLRAVACLHHLPNSLRPGVPAVSHDRPSDCLVKMLVATEGMSGPLSLLAGFREVM